MNMRFVVCFVCCLIVAESLAAESFVVNKRKPQNQSMNKLKENYADELACLVRMIPEMQKQLADLQERLIDELYTLINNEIDAGKIEIDSRTCKAQELRCFFEKDYQSVLPIKTAFLPKKTKQVVLTK
jgi:hypothetical protein